MVEEPLDPILIQVTVPLPLPLVYAALTDPAQLQGWLCERAEVGSAVGESYRLSFTEPQPFESSGRIVQRTNDLDIGFTWFGPPEFSAFKNQGGGPQGQVYLRLQESPEGVDVTLEHSGWGVGPDWEEARSWHFHFWDERLSRLKDYLIKTAYG